MSPIQESSGYQPTAVTSNYTVNFESHRPNSVLEVPNLLRAALISSFELHPIQERMEFAVTSGHIVLKSRVGRIGQTVLSKFGYATDSYDLAF
ncbi:hypothetical protein LTR09_009136 [Extremus antarcticus]|uniref:Uncharacterized protein n=1 Tax=Extremus antarcticus TaxID=702011 RepID=A0AAJ0G6G4_9PEZI|nr:hypothetical protein LTR09_009136 [Extremus antarcticus]